MTDDFRSMASAIPFAKLPPTMQELIDKARPVRPGEELDIASLERYLSERLDGPAGPLVVEQFPCGFSNLTYLLRLGKRELVLRRPPFGNRVATAHDMEREHRVLSRLSAVYPLAPEALLYCGDEAVIGAPFYVMQRCQGVILNRATAHRVALDPATARRLSEAFLDNLVALHRADYAAAGLGGLGKPEGYPRRQVDGWRRRYEKARTHDHRRLEEAAAWLGEEVWENGGAALVHNDYKLDNLVLDPDDLPTIRAVLDWEMTTVGDPVLDLGTSLAYWRDPDDTGPLAALDQLPPAFPGSLSRRQLVERYVAAMAGRDGLNAAELRDRAHFAYVFGLFKVAVIAQQIYARWAKGHTADQRFAGLDQVVGLLGETAATAIERERI